MTDNISVDSEDEGMRVIKQAVQKYYDMGYKRVDVKTSVNEQGHPVVEIIPSKFEGKEKQKQKLQDRQDNHLSILLGEQNHKLVFKSEDIVEHEVIAEHNLIAIHLKVGSVVRDESTGKAMVIQDSDNQFVGKVYIPEHKQYLTELDELLVEAKQLKKQADVGMKDAFLMELS